MTYTPSWRAGPCDFHTRAPGYCSTYAPRAWAHTCPRCTRVPYTCHPHREADPVIQTVGYAYVPRVHSAPGCTPKYAWHRQRNSTPAAQRRARERRLIRKPVSMAAPKHAPLLASASEPPPRVATCARARPAPTVGRYEKRWCPWSWVPTVGSLRRKEGVIIRSINAPHTHTDPACLRPAGSSPCADTAA